MRILRTPVQFVLTTFVLGILFSANLQAQAISGDLVGTVLDSTGAVVPNASVTATNPATGIKSTATANGNGEYRISNLIPASYDVSASAAGFTASEVKGVNIRLNQTATVNITISVGTVSTSVEVTEAAAVLDTTTAQLQSTFTTKQVADLPTTSSGVGVINLSLLSPGVTSSGGVGVGVGPSVGGQRPRNNNFTIDGVDNNLKSTTGPVVYLPNESVAEFSLLQNEFRAEFGHSSGGQFTTIVKSGTNTRHGTIYEYYENKNFNALDQTFKNQGITKIPRYDRSHLGANFGGPIKKDKLFFFTSFEYNPLGQASTTGSPVYAPTAAGYSTIGTLAGVSQTNLNVMKTYAVAPALTAGAPSITIGGTTIPTGIIPISAPNYRNAFYGVFSMDYNLSEKDQIRGRFTYNRIDTISTAATLPVFYTLVPSRYDLGSLAEYHTFSPSVTNELRLAYQRQNSNSPVGSQTFPGLSAFPNLVFNNLNLQIGPNSNFPQSTVNNLYQATDAVTWTLGAHTIKIGSEFRDYISPQNFSQRVRGDYEYTTAANYLLDLTPDYLGQRNLGTAVYYGNQLATYSFVQDTWRVRPNLTLDLGLRYEYTTVPLGIQAQKLNAIASVPGLLTFNAPSASPYGIGPRIGLAWSPSNNSSTVVRAGFGIAYDVIFDNVGLNAVPPQFATTVNVAQLGVGTNFLANGGITAAQGLTSPTAAAARAATSAYLPNQTLPYSINYTLDIQHVFAQNYTFDIRYLGTRGVHEIMQQQINRFSPVTATVNIPTYMAAPSAATLATLPYTVGNIRALGSILPQYAAAGFTSTITSYQPQGYSQYNAMSAQLSRRFSNGLQGQLAYTWSHNIDNSTAEVASTYLTPRRAQDFQSIAGEKASSALDRRQRLTLSFVYDAPWFSSSKNWFMKNLAGNWEIAPVYTYESPEYYTVQSGVDSNLNGDSAPDRTIVNPSGTAGIGSSVYGLTRTGAVVAATAAAASVNNVVAWVATNPNAQYIQAGVGAYANAGRNTQASRPIDNIDVTVIKHFTFRDRYRLDLEGQAYNLFNHAQFIPGSVNDAGTVSTFNTGTLSYASAANAAFNNPSLAFSSNPRTMQVVARFNW